MSRWLTEGPLAIEIQKRAQVKKEAPEKKKKKRLFQSKGGRAVTLLLPLIKRGVAALTGHGKSSVVGDEK